MSGDITFHLDEQQPDALADALRKQGIPVVTTREAGLISCSDEEHLDYAVRLGQVVVTHDADFQRLHRTGYPHTGIVFVPHGKRTLKQVVQGLTVIHSTYTLNSMRGRIVFL